IAAHVRATFDERRTARLLERIDELDRRRDAVPPAQWPVTLLPCPLLEDERCSIYPVRPFVCRSVTSYDAGACEASRKNPAGPPAIPADALIRAIARAAVTAFRRTADGAPGGGGRLDLARALRVALA